MRAGKESGFTLIEVVAAVALLGIAVSLLLTAVSQGVLAQNDTADTTVAVWLCRQKMDRIQTRLDPPGAGRFDPPWDRFSWQAVDDLQAPLHRLTVTVFWAGSLAPRQVHLTALSREEAPSR